MTTPDPRWRWRRCFRFSLAASVLFIILFALTLRLNVHYVRLNNTSHISYGAAIRGGSLHWSYMDWNNLSEITGCGIASTFVGPLPLPPLPAEPTPAVRSSFGIHTDRWIPIVWMPQLLRPGWSITLPLWPLGVTLFTFTFISFRKTLAPAPHQCQRCRYDLTGITCTLCPECGTPR